MRFEKGIREFKTVREIAFELDIDDDKVHRIVKSCNVHADRIFSPREMLIFYPDSVKRIEMCLALQAKGIKSKKMALMIDKEIQDLLKEMKK